MKKGKRNRSQEWEEGYSYKLGFSEADSKAPCTVNTKMSARIVGASRPLMGVSLTGLAPTSMLLSSLLNWEDLSPKWPLRFGLYGLLSP